MTDYKIYQIPCNDENHGVVFESLEHLEKYGEEFKKGRYELVYESKVETELDLDGLEELYFKLNMEHPKDYKARSLSVSDVVEVSQNGEMKAWFVGSFGFTEVTERWKEEATCQFIQ